MFVYVLLQYITSLLFSWNTNIKKSIFWKFSYSLHRCVTLKLNLTSSHPLFNCRFQTFSHTSFVHISIFNQTLYLLSICDPVLCNGWELVQDWSQVRIDWVIIRTFWDAQMRCHGIIIIFSAFLQCAGYITQSLRITLYIEC